MLDEKKQPLSAERVTQDSTVRVPLPAGLAKDASTTLTFEYEGQLESGDNSPVPGLKLAYIGDDTSYLFYSGRWFPVSGFGLNRFTSTISVTVPAHMLVIGSGKSTVTDAPASNKPNASVLPTKTFTFVSTKPSFPGTIVAGVFQEYKSDEAGMDLHVFFKPTHQSLAPAYTTTAVQEFTYFITLYGLPPSQKLNVVELPGDTLALRLGAGNRRTGRAFHYGENQLSPAGQCHRAPVVGRFGKSRDQGRLVAERRLLALFGSHVRGERRRSRGPGRSGKRYVGRRAGL